MNFKWTIGKKVVSLGVGLVAGSLALMAVLNVRSIGLLARDAADVAAQNLAEDANRTLQTGVHRTRDEILQFLKRKWNKELDYRLIKELWAFTGNRIAVRFAYEWHDDSGQWFRSYGNENWEFNENGFMQRRMASINDLPIKESERKYHWPLGRRPDDHPSLSELGL